MGDFFAELRRRHIYRIGAVYVVVAWGITQVLDVLSQLFALPDWIAQPAVIVLAIGFPITLVVAWLIEGKAPEAVASAMRSPATTVDWVLAGAVAVVIGLIGYQQFAPRTTEIALSAEPEIIAVAEAETEAEEVSDVLPNSIAVLPFQNLSVDPENAFFAAGIHDTLLNELSKISDMNVISRTSVLRYADGQTPIPQIAAELNVETVMEGTVQYADGQVRITAQLIDPDTGAHLWSDNYDRDFSGIFAIQTEIASNIAMALEAELLPNERESIEQPLTDSSDAYALYLRAITTVGDPAPFTPPDLFAEAHRFLDQAIEIDPEFAHAHAYKALLYSTSLGGVSRLSDELSLAERETLAREHVETALRFNPNVGLAYDALARLHASFFREAEARQAYERAYQLNPNDTDVLFDFHTFSMRADQYEAGIRLARRLPELNPGYGHFILGHSLWWAGNDYEAAAAALGQGIDLRPADWLGHLLLSQVEVARGNHAKALEEAQLGDSLSADNFLAPSMVSAFAHLYGRTGSPEDAIRLFGQLEAMAAEYNVGSATWALAYLAIGEQERALEWLNTAAENRIPDGGFMVLWWLRANAFSDPVLEQPEFVEVRSRLGFM